MLRQKCVHGGKALVQQVRGRERSQSAVAVVCWTIVVVLLFFGLFVLAFSLLWQGSS